MLLCKRYSWLTLLWGLLHNLLAGLDLSQMNGYLYIAIEECREKLTSDNDLPCLSRPVFASIYLKGYYGADVYYELLGITKSTHNAFNDFIPTLIWTNHLGTSVRFTRNGSYASFIHVPGIVTAMAIL
jgi:hypothetical protein